MKQLADIELELFYKRKLDHLMKKTQGKSMAEVVPFTAMRFDRMEIIEQIDAASMIAKKLIEKRKPSFLSRLFGLNFGAKKIAEYNNFLHDLENLKKDIQLHRSLKILHIEPKIWNSKMPIKNRLQLVNFSEKAILDPENKLIFAQKSTVKDARRVLCTMSREESIHQYRRIKVASLPESCKVTMTKLYTALRTLGLSPKVWYEDMGNAKKQYQLRHELLDNVVKMVHFNKREYNKATRLKMVEAIKLLTIAMDEEYSPIRLSSDTLDKLSKVKLFLTLSPTVPVSKKAENELLKQSIREEIQHKAEAKKPPKMNFKKALIILGISEENWGKGDLAIDFRCRRELLADIETKIAFKQIVLEESKQLKVEEAYVVLRDVMHKDHDKYEHQLTQNKKLVMSNKAAGFVDSVQGVNKRRNIIGTESRFIRGQ